ncbi:alpha-L-fucosidase [Plantactinospora soyae]|uniref:alpha-L-fucosidase n=1 Tax=Plantactinospora soyae TaxID=1544732 RepID=A0A927RC38_9ACTN|nr:alpha-L-fucosidase [Plantactinospora soyae]MBE1492286.1 alpha-L-fucosidase [Plantactinospora soyae]
MRAFIRRHRKKLLVGLVVLTLLVATPPIAAAVYAWRDDRLARMTTEGPYRATRESLNAHPVPDWFSDAKFGIFIHWGLFSVPGFAPTGNYADVLRSDYDRAMLVHPYAEDYGNAMRDPSTPTAEHHRATYGNLPYEGFKAMFDKGLERWDPNAWAKTFRDSGARYVVLVAKYHDGYALWPTGVRHPHRPGWHSERDIVGELATAVRAQGLRFGVYYSGGVDWTFQRDIVRTLGDYTYARYGDGYADYADAQLRELVIRYKPDLLWNDISWPTGQKRLFSLLADYYNTVPDGVVNDRWQTDSFWRWTMGTTLGRAGFDRLMKWAIADDPEFIDNVTPPAVPHSDFTTPEYTQYDTVRAKKWETTRGIGNSYGFNRMERDQDYASFPDTLLPDFVDAVAKNGNLLLNVGPSGGEGTLPPEQLRRLAGFGRWLDANGAAIYASRPWSRPESEGAHFTLGRDGAVNVILGGPVTGDRVRLAGVQLTGTARLLGDDSPVALTVEGPDTVLTFARPPAPDALKPAIRITPG